MERTKMSDVWAIRICSPKKDMEGHYLHEIYTNPMLQAFFRFMEQNQFRYAIMSRKLGICPDILPTTPYPDRQELGDLELKDLLQSQAPGWEKVRFVYWNHRPLTHDKWIGMLRECGFHVDQVSKLKDYLKHIWRGL
jgi:hypothetical protein